MGKLFKKNNTDAAGVNVGGPGGQEKKKWSGKKKVLVLGAVLAAGFFGYRAFSGGSSTPVVTTASAVRQDISQTLDTSGTVISDKVVSYFAPVSAKIGDIKVKKGETVKKGEVVVAYDETSLTELKTLTELSLKANNGGYQDSVEKNQKQQSMYTEATTNLEILKQQISDTQARIDAAKKRMEKKEADLAWYGTALEISRLDWADQPESQEYQNLLKLIQQNQYDQKNHPELRQLRDEIAKDEKLLSEYKAYESEMKSQKNSSEGSKLSSGGQAQAKANADAEGLKLEKRMTAIQANEQGITAEFNGVVTQMDAVQGKTPQEGELLFRLESLEDVVVSLSVSKYDLDKLKVGQAAKLTIAGKTYEGKVSRIEQMATKNTNGAAVVGAYIQITNPDQSLFLGVEAKVSVSTGEAKGAITVPSEAINTDVEGQFVYAVENGIVVKKRVVTGLVTDLDIEIKEGLEEGAQVITQQDMGISEGMAVSTFSAT